MMSLVWALGGWSAVVLLFVLVATARACRRAYPDPENGHEGRVLPAGASVVEAIRASSEDLEELSLDRKGLAPEVAKIREEKPRLACHDAKDLLREMLDTNRFEEQALLGAIITGAAPVDLLPGVWWHSNFSDPRHCGFFMTILKRHKQGKPIDRESLKHEWAIYGTVEDLEYVDKLARMAATPEEAAEYARRLRDRHRPA